MANKQFPSIILSSNSWGRPLKWWLKPGGGSASVLRRTPWWFSRSRNSRSIWLGYPVLSHPHLCRPFYVSWRMLERCHTNLRFPSRHVSTICQVSVSEYFTTNLEYLGKESSGFLIYHALAFIDLVFLNPLLGIKTCSSLSKWPGEACPDPPHNLLRWHHPLREALDLLDGSCKGRETPQEEAEETRVWTVNDV